MKRPLGWLVGTVGIVLWIFAFGFIVFAVEVMHAPKLNGESADGIIVLTGGELRIKEGFRLLDEGLGRRLLITGVHPRTRKADIARIAGGAPAGLDCCVDLGYEALNTRGNADEAKAWAQKHKFKSLIVVTASYHMPRSLMELTGRMPEIDFIPHPVFPEGFRDSEWWLDAGTSRVLFSEYVKLLPAAVRHVTSRAISGGATASDSRAAHSAGPL